MFNASSAPRLTALDMGGLPFCLLAVFDLTLRSMTQPSVATGLQTFFLTTQLACQQ